uniref:Splicing factor 45 n=1 Tax=Tetraselmis sp. GSL018 TaxID=582737 RepID=A0A061R517_9CHLO
MSLYGDLPSAKDDRTGSPLVSWSGKTGATSMLPPSALRKRAMNFPVPTSVKKSAGKEVEVSAPSATSSDTLLGAVGTLSGINPKDEYDPARPNDYEEVRRERERLRQEAEAEADRQAKLKEAEERQAEEQRLAATRPPEQRESALKISGEEAFLRRGRIGRAGPDPAEGGAMAPPNPPAAEGGGMTAAQRMMEKMGWKAGQGLGKARQGMTTPLMAQKTDTHSAVIVNAEPVTAPPPGNPDERCSSPQHGRARGGRRTARGRGRRGVQQVRAGEPRHHLRGHRAGIPGIGGCPHLCRV